jgi:glycosyltransferase involved in cell wall biosynthesis
MPLDTKSTSRISIIIPTRNRPAALARCLRSIINQTYTPAEVIIVDASETRQSCKLVESIIKENPSFELKYNTIAHELHGIPKQRNIGVRLSRCEIVGFLDDDVELFPSYLENIWTIFVGDTSRQIGGVEGRIVNIKPFKLRVRHRLEKHFGLFDVGKILRLDRIMPLLPEGDSPMDVEWLHGCNCFFRREVFYKNGFEEEFEGYAIGEDFVFSFVVAKSWKLCYQPKANLNHYLDPSGRLSSYKLARMSVKHQYYIYRYLLDGKALADYLIFWFYMAYVLILQLFRILKRSRNGSFAALHGLMMGILDVIMGEYPRRSKSVEGVLLPGIFGHNLSTIERS